MSSAAKMSIGAAVVVAAIMAAIIMTVTGGGTAGTADDADAAESAAGAGGVSEARPAGAPAAGSSSDVPLRGIVLDRLDGGGAVDVGADLAGKPSLVNLWAYWCAPCREELPALERFARSADGAVNVLTVHSDARPEAGEKLLGELGVDLPAVEDRDKAVAAAVGAPPVLPVTVMLRADGTVAKVVVRAFDDPHEIADAVSEYLGVTL